MATTYHDGQAHRMLAHTAGDLLEHFTISTKVSPRADLAPLTEQAKRAVCDLGLPPAVLLVHNPEHVLRGLPTAQAGEWWATTAEVMADLVAAGACRAWGIACWDPRPLLGLLDTPAWTHAPQPAVAMVRAGFLVPADVLAAGDALLDRLQYDGVHRWGMSPFAGAPRLLDGINLTQFLTDHVPRAAASPLPTAVAAAFHMPAVSRLAVGTGSPAHLDQLTAATTLPVDQERVSAYRQRLTAHASSAR
ncbi:hypothetical protein [Haloechinothrix aidingensis]|uniref:hypothetical protein n=1 Tax=Haloechinothrix aidingensis TaxID=2752311 RepID=UPI0031B63142